MSQIKHKHYFPIIKSKAGEVWTLANLSDQARDMITPVIELLPPRKKEPRKHVASLFEDLQNAWGMARPLFLDTVYLGTGGASDVDTLEKAFKASRHFGLKAVPVTSLGRSPQYQAAVQRLIAVDDRGLMIRLTARDFRDSATLARALTALLGLMRITHDKADILIDYGARPEASEVIQFVRIHIPQLPELANWRTLAVASGCVPKSLKDITAPGQWRHWNREEWEAWTTAVTGEPELERLPSYSDYGVRDPGKPAERGSPSANLRYTSEQDYLFFKGPQVIREHGSQSMPAICKSLTEQPEFCGEQFSAGDREIASLATKVGLSDIQTGNPQQWTQWCMNHHFEFVVRQLANFSAT